MLYTNPQAHVTRPRHASQPVLQCFTLRTTERLREVEVEAGCGRRLCTTERLREVEAEAGGLEHDDQDLALPAFARTAVPLTSTSRAGGSCRSWASNGVCGSS